MTEVINCNENLLLLLLLSFLLLFLLFWRSLRSVQASAVSLPKTRNIQN